MRTACNRGVGGGGSKNWEKKAYLINGRPLSDIEMNKTQLTCVLGGGGEGKD